MATYNFATVAGTTIAFDPASDVITFANGYSANALAIEQSGNDVLVRHNGSVVRLSVLTFAQLGAANFSFANGSLVALDLAGNDTLSGSAFGDYIDIRKGGSDAVNAGAGADRIYAGSSLSAGDAIAGGTPASGTEVDTLLLGGNYASTVTLGATTVTGVERIEVAAGSTIRLKLAAQTVSSAQGFVVDATAQAQGDLLALDGSLTTTGFSVLAGAGNDVITGGSGNDTLSGGAGNDVIVGGAGADAIIGGLGADTLTGGAGIDTFSFGTGIPRAESAPSTIDVVTDFEGAGAAGGDLVNLPAFSGSLPLAFNIAPVDFQFAGLGVASGVQLPADLVGDGFADVVWRYNATQNRVEVWVDANDDGQFSEVDMLFYLGGATSLIFSDFVNNFPVWRGTQGNDTYDGNADNNTAYGIGGDDTINGYGGNDILYGGAGFDTIDGGTGSDTIYGGTEGDTLRGGDGSDSLFGEDGADTLYGGNDGDSLYAGTDVAGVVNRLYGEAGNDSLSGGNGDDVLDGGTGDDYLSGGAGTDTLTGGDGVDSLYGGAGTDTLVGGAGQDFLSGEAGTDTLTGGADADTFYVYYYDSSTLAQTDTVTDYNRAEGDRISIGYPNPAGPAVFRGVVTTPGFTLTAGATLGGSDLGGGFTQYWSYRSGATTYLLVDSNDNRVLDSTDLVLALTGANAPTSLVMEDFVGNPFTVRVGTAGNDVGGQMEGSASADTIYGIGGNDTINGYGGNDILYGGAGVDTIDGGLGSDTVYGGTEGDTLRGGDGGDVLYGEDGADTIYGGNDGDTLYAGTDAAGVVNSLYGEAGNDYLSGGSGDDVLDGGADTDSLYGAAGADTLRGGDGQDYLSGDAGADTLTGGADADTFYVYYYGQSSQAAYDTITDYDRAEGDRISIGYPNPVGPAVFRGNVTTPGFTLTAGATLGGGDLGSGFTQYWSYRSGSTTYLLVDSNDNRLLDSTDLVLAFTGATAPTSLAIEDFLGNPFTVRVGTPGNDVGGQMEGSATADTIYGIGGDDTINGNGGNDSLYGGAGIDTIDGGIGSDTLYGGTEGDTLRGGDGGDTLYGEDGADTLYGGNDADSLYAGNDAAGVVNRLYGEAGNDYLYGGNGDDVLDGGADDDTLNGGGGTDTLLGGDGGDTLYGGAGTDTLRGGDGQDYVAGEGGIDTLSGGADADTFYVYYYGHSTLAETDTVTDYNRAEGDRISIGYPNPVGPAVFRGNVTTPGFTLTAGATLGGSDLGSGFTQYWSYRSGSTTYLLVDSNDNRTLDSTDLVLALTGATAPTSLITDDFTGNPFTVRVGTAGNDAGGQMEGSATADTIYGIGGDDTINGNGGNDYLYGGAGVDTIDGGLGGDSIYGGTEGDTLRGGDGGDALYGEDGADTLYGGNDADSLYAGNDAAGVVNSLYGEAGNDYLYGGSGDDVLEGGADDDSLNGGGGTDTLRGGDGADTIYGGAGTDILIGGAGQDFLSGDSGVDTLTGGTQADTFYVYYYGHSTLAETDTVTDYNRAEGDRISIGYPNPVGPAVFRGTVTTPGFTLTAGATLGGGDLGSGFTQYWSYRSGSTTYLLVDSNDNRTLDSTDLVLALTGPNAPTALTRDDFTGNPFSALVGTGGNDLIDGTATADAIYGAPGDDTINGLDGGDTLYGNAGNDTIDGGLGGDAIYGGVGNDIVRGGDGGDSIYGEDGADTLFGEVGQDYIVGGTGEDTIDGGADNDTIYGSEGDDVLHGGANDDYVDGGAGNDLIDGGLQNDTLSGGAGADLFYFRESGDGDDRINGFSVVEDRFLLESGLFTAVSEVGGNTTLTYSGGTIVVAGVTGRTLAQWNQLVTSGGELLGNGSDVFTGTAAADLVHGEGGNDQISGSDGNDRLFGDTGQDTLNGDAGDDELTGGAGNDTLNGGTDSDTAIFSGNLADYAITPLGGGVVRVTDGRAGTPDGTDTLTQVEFIRFADQTVATSTYVGGTITGTAGNDIITPTQTVPGQALPSALDDTIDALGGNDIIDGGAGADRMTGGTGNDTYYVDDAGDVVIEANGAGTDVVYSSVSFTLAGQFIETLTLTGTANINATGNGQANTLNGNAGNNVLNGGGGADKMAGGLGDDTYYVDNAGDTVIEASGAGNDTVLSGVSITLAGTFIENLTLTGAAAINATGNSQANTIAGNAAANVLDGGGGIDTLSYAGAGAAVTVDLSLTTQQDTLGAGLDTIANFESIIGSAFADTLTGNALSNVLNGGAGADRMAGGLGNDTYYVDVTGDVVIEAAGAGTDTIYSSVSFGLGGQFVETLNLTGTADISASGNGQANSLFGNSGKNIISGGAGDDLLAGGLGADTLIGGAGADRFRFADALGGGNIDRISDFAAGDRIQLDDAIFGALATGNLAANAFVAGAVATDANSRILYVASSGALFYDADGTGATAAVQFATVTSGYVMGASDFVVI